MAPVRRGADDAEARDRGVPAVAVGASIAAHGVLVPHSREDLLAYLDQCLTKVGQVLRSLAHGESIHLRGSIRLEMSALEVVLYELRHVQHHAAQLNALLRIEGAEPPRWVRRLEGPPLDESTEA